MYRPGIGMYAKTNTRNIAGKHIISSDLYLHSFFKNDRLFVTLAAIPPVIVLPLIFAVSVLNISTAPQYRENHTIFPVFL